jgi:hypothetical protein
MSCRATCQHPPIPILVICADCGVSDLHTFYTPNELGLHLCPTCFDSRVKCELAKDGRSQPSPQVP